MHDKEITLKCLGDITAQYLKNSINIFILKCKHIIYGLNECSTDKKKSFKLASQSFWEITPNFFYRFYPENAICSIDNVMTTVEGFHGRSRSIANII